MPNAVAALRDYFGFVEFPSSLNEFNFSKGISFKHGRSRSATESRETVVGELKIFSNGLLVSSQTPTEDMDLFLDDLFECIKKRLDTIFIPDEDRGKAYTSNLEVIIEKPIPSTDVEVEIAKKLYEHYKSYGNRGPAFEKSSFTISFDSTPNLPTQFSISRRVGISYKNNTYFSEAPLKTGHHIALLQKYEKAL